MIGGGLLTVLLLAGGCSTGGDQASGSFESGSSDSGASGSEVGQSGDREVAPAAPADQAGGSTADADTSTTSSRGVGAQNAAVERAVISTGNVVLRAADVGATLADVQQVVDQVRGQVTERSSESDDEGELTRARLLLRVPAASFGQTMADLEDLGPAVELVSSDSDSQDVTTQLIDTEARVEVAQRSIDRVAVLLDGAESIADVVAVEAQLAQREADLASLVQQQVYLGDQSSLSTITVSVRAPAVSVEPDDGDEAGFGAGLSSGWDALSGSAVVALTLLGSVVPWLALALLVGLPGAALTRRLRRRTSSTARGTDAQAAPAGPTT